MSPKGAVYVWAWIILMTFPLAGNAVAADIIFKPSIEVEESYDSNPTLGSVQNAKEDYITSVMPKIEFYLQEKVLSLNCSYGLNSRYYSNKPGLNYVSHSGNVAIKMDISERTSLSLSDSLSYTKDSREADDIGIQTNQTGIFSNTVLLGLNQRLNKLTTITLRGSDSFSKFDDTGFIDSRTDSAGVDVIRELTPFRSVNASYTYTNFVFENSVQNSSNANSFQLGILERLTKDISLNLAGGTVYSSDFGSKYDWSAQTSLSKKSEKSVISIGYSRGVTTSSGLTDEINISDRGTMVWSQTLNKNLNAILSGVYSENHTEPTSSVKLKSYDAAIRTDWTPDPLIRIGIGYSRFQQWAEGPLGNDYTRDIVSVSVTALSDGWRF